MARRTIKVRYSAPVSLTLCFVSFVVLALNEFVLPGAGITSGIFSLHGARGAEAAFDFAKPLNYARILLYVFGSKGSAHFLQTFAFVLPLGMNMEERYGSPLVALMALASTVVTGVLNVCLVQASLCGSLHIALMLILLCAFTALSKKELPLSYLVLFALCAGSGFYFYRGIGKWQLVAVIAAIIGGLSGSIFGLLTAPKSKKSRAGSGRSGAGFGGRGGAKNAAPSFDVDADYNEDDTIIQR